MEKLKVIYIASLGHSGSTLLDVLLNQHEKIRSVGEIMFLDEWTGGNYLCSCGEKISECPFWIQARSNSVTSLGPINEAAYVANSTALFKAIGKLSDVRVIVDSSKSPQRLRQLLTDPALDVKVIHLVRNGLGVVNSLKKSHKRPGTGSDQMTVSTPVLKGIIRWWRRNRAIDQLLGSLETDNYLQVRYEDLCQDPESMLTKICEMAEMEFHPAMLSPDLLDNHNISGSRWRFSDKPIQIRLDEKWKNEVGVWTKLMFQIIAGRLNKKYGY